ncbi:hypothetical protein NM688_g3484 [Phlebia brevispora]|uniref:Uncharacterized protein n=1 Tax=Phlebia brevispora TaxID=194682 RepID=A0ACC1T697_9APHY|nr:hypothetical protein NM688_g3484 [Phlebia brevispora]
MKFSAVFTSFGCLAAVLAAPFHPVEPERREVLSVYDPKILNPTAQTVWVVGETYEVTWDTSGLPPAANITNLIGQVVLGQLSDDSENLNLNNPLASGFLITDGEVSITVPSVTPGSYIIVLFGDSGNTSPQFQIVDAPSTSSSGVVPISTSVAAASQSSESTTPVFSPSPVPAKSTPTPQTVLSPSEIQSSLTATESSASATSGPSSSSASAPSSSPSFTSLNSHSLTSLPSIPSPPLTASLPLSSAGGLSTGSIPGSSQSAASSNPLASVTGGASNIASAAQGQRVPSLVFALSVSALAGLLTL